MKVQPHYVALLCLYGIFTTLLWGCYGINSGGVQTKELSTARSLLYGNIVVTAIACLVSAYARKRTVMLVVSIITIVWTFVVFGCVLQLLMGA